MILKKSAIFTTLSLLVIAAFIGCLRSTNKEDILEAEVLNIDVKNSSTLIFSEVFYPPTYIHLETNQYSLLSDIYQIVISDSIIFIAAEPNGLILEFYMDGSFKESIYNVGRGPDEYLHTYYIWVDADSNRILLLDSGASIVSMNYQGNDVKKFPAKNIVAQALSVHPVTKHILIDLAYGGIFNPDNIQKYQYFQVLVFDPSNNTYRTWLPMEANIRTLCPSGFTLWGNTVYYKPRIWDTIYQVGIDDVKPRYILNFGDNSKPKELLNTADESLIMKLRKVPGFVYEHLKFVETDDYILSTHEINRGNPILHLRNKHSGEISVFNKYINDYLGDTRELSLRRYVSSEFGDGTMVVNYEPIELLKNHERLKSILTADELSQFMINNPSYATMIASLNENDNPVLAIYRFK